MNLYLFAIESIKQHRINTILFPEFRQNPKKNSKSDRTWKTNLVKIGTILKGFGEDWFSSNWSGSEPMWIELWRRIWGSNDDGSCDLANGDKEISHSSEREKTQGWLSIWRDGFGDQGFAIAIAIELLIFVFDFDFGILEENNSQTSHRFHRPLPCCHVAYGTSPSSPYLRPVPLSFNFFSFILDPFISTGRA